MIIEAGSRWQFKQAVLELVKVQRCPLQHRYVASPDVGQLEPKQQWWYTEHELIDFDRSCPECRDIIQQRWQECWKYYMRNVNARQ